MKKIPAMLFSVSQIVASQSASAHGSRGHIAGIPSEVARGHVAIQRSDGKVVAIRFTSETRVLQGAKKVEQGLLQVGTRVEAEAQGDYDALRALEIEVPIPPPAVQYQSPRCPCDQEAGGAKELDWPDPRTATDEARSALA